MRILWKDNKSRKMFAELQFTWGLNDIDDINEKNIVKSRGIIKRIGYIYLNLQIDG